MLPCANQLQQRCQHHQHRPQPQQQLTPTHRPHARRAHTAARAQTTTTTAAPLDQQAVAAAIPQPLPDYDYKSDILPETLEVVQQQYPQLLGLVQAGNLVVYRRPASYRERRTDGYQEPALIFILGTAHVSDQSAADVSQLIQAVQPDAVVVELCKSRTGVLNTGEEEGGPQQQQQQQQQQQDARLQDHQARWQQQWQQWQQRKEPGGAAAAAAATSSSSATNSAEDEKDTSPHQSLATTDTAAVTSSSNSSSSSGSQAPGGVWQQLRASLTASRASKASNPLSLAGADPVSALARSAALGGQQAMLLRLLIAGQARKAADQLGVQPGAEFRAAAAAAAAVPGGGCCLVLGDRPIEITLSRAWEALSWRRRAQLLGDLMTAGLAASDKAVLSQAQVESLRSDDAISGLFKSLSDRYPELVAPLITERDLYLSWSLKRSKAVNGTRVVVGCVGKGHLRGIVYALKHDNGNLRFKDLVGGKNNRQNRRAAAAAAARRLLLELVLGAAAYAAWVAATAGPSGQ